MRIKGRTLLRTALLLSVAVGSFARTATASTVLSYTFQGTLKTVTGVPGAQVGDVIKGSFSYDSSLTGSLITPGLYAFVGSPKAHTFSFSIYNGGVQVFYDTYTGSGTVATGGLFSAKLTYNATAGTNLDLTGDTVTKYNVGHTARRAWPTT